MCQRKKEKQHLPEQSIYVCSSRLKKNNDGANAVVILLGNCQIVFAIGKLFCKSPTYSL